MLFATRPRLFHPRFLALLVAFAGLASSCQSSRPGLAFQPIPGRARAVPMAVPATVATEDPAAAEATLVAASPKPRAGIRPENLERQPLRPAPATVAAAPAVPAEAVHTKPVMHRRALLHRPHATAEVGLGTTVLGVLGLVVLPIALIGLLLGGGLVWGVLAGLAALAVLVAYIDPFGR